MEVSKEQLFILFKSCIFRLLSFDDLFKEDKENEKEKLDGFNKDDSGFEFDMEDSFEEFSEEDLEEEGRGGKLVVNLVIFRIRLMVNFFLVNFVVNLFKKLVDEFDLEEEIGSEIEEFFEEEEEEELVKFDM